MVSHTYISISRTSLPFPPPCPHFNIIISYTGWPKKTEQQTSHNMWMQYWYQVGELSSEKNDTKISNFWFISLFSMAHFVRQYWGPKFSLFQLELGVNECHFGLPQLLAVIHLTLSMRIVMSGFLVWKKQTNFIPFVSIFMPPTRRVPEALCFRVVRPSVRESR